jgi:serine phosphatase RsbU (regulator of sigma subunit)
MHEEHSPASILSKVNNCVYKAAPLSSFTTVFLAILNTASGKLTYCSAGHPPAIIRRPTARASILAAGSPPIGIFDELSYGEQETKLEAGDVLFAYTDGLIEARRDRELFGEKRLMKLIKELKSVPAPELPDTVYGRAFDFSEGKLVDDIAILAISLKK